MSGTIIALCEGRILGELSFSGSFDAGSTGRLRAYDALQQWPETDCLEVYHEHGLTVFNGDALERFR